MVIFESKNWIEFYLKVPPKVGVFYVISPKKKQQLQHLKRYKKNCLWMTVLVIGDKIDAFSPKLIFSPIQLNVSF